MPPMPQLPEVDSAEILVLVDNVTDNLSSAPRFVETELAAMSRRGINVLAGDCLCCAAHGLACLITVTRGGQSRTLLFDSGPEADVLSRNVQRLDADLGVVEAIVLSHGHWDHGGGMLRALDLIRGRNGGREIPYYAHPGMFRQRAAKLPDGRFRLMEDVPSRKQLAMHGARVVATTEPQHPLDGMFFVSGEIPRVTPFERGLPGQHRLADDGITWEPDELLMDERFVAVNIKGKGLVVFSACSHAGIVNVVTHARQSFPGTRVHGIMGGLHLSGTNEKIIPETVAALGSFDLGVIAAGHCTGWRAMTALANAFGDQRLAPLSVGKRFTF
jgi:7,8-dihydropterin-6-yl-methyl-4-(beta-D-ribofuranosyl)aminobenzene 5'-phosphate synthase